MPRWVCRRMFRKVIHCAQNHSSPKQERLQIGSDRNQDQDRDRIQGRSRGRGRDRSRDRVDSGPPGSGSAASRPKDTKFWNKLLRIGAFQRRRRVKKVKKGIGTLFSGVDALCLMIKWRTARYEKRSKRFARRGCNFVLSSSISPAAPAPSTAYAVSDTVNGSSYSAVNVSRSTHRPSLAASCAGPLPGLLPGSWPGPLPGSLSGPLTGLLTDPH